MVAANIVPDVSSGVGGIYFLLSDMDEKSLYEYEWPNHLWDIEAVSDNNYHDSYSKEDRECLFEDRNENEAVI